MFFISLLVFVIFYVLPSGDPAALRAGRNSTPASIAAIRHQLGLDDPLPQQYWRYMKGLVLHFDLGHSFTNDADVKSLLFDRIPNTLFLVIGAALLWLAPGIGLRVVSAGKRGRRPRPTATGGAV